MSNPAKPTTGELGGVYLRIGNFTFGGGGTTIAVLQREMVTVRGWLDTTQFGLCFVLARVTPGTNLLAFCTGTGWLLRRWRGAIVGLLAASIPSCALVALVTKGFDVWSTQRLVQIAIDGALAASVGMLLASFWSVVSPYMKRERWVESVAIIAVSIGLSSYFGLSPVLILVLAAIAGFLRSRRAVA